MWRLKEFVVVVVVVVFVVVAFAFASSQAFDPLKHLAERKQSTMTDASCSPRVPSQLRPMLTRLSWQLRLNATHLESNGDSSKLILPMFSSLMPFSLLQQLGTENFAAKQDPATSFQTSKKGFF